ncbi:tail fiber domain-containing protein [Escherichia coli O70:H38]
MIYTTGTIAISGNTVTGLGTNFTAPLSLIRVGCTLIAVGNPVQIFTITEIKSGTELSVTPAANPTIAAGTKFSILLSDSISVDGLAQDVAETLRYYQGKETEISEAIEFFQEFDFNALTAQINQVHTDSAQVSADKATVQQYKTDSESAKSAAEAAKDKAVLAQTAAETANTSAQASSTAAQGFRDQAEEWAQSVNPDNLLTKSGNLAGLADKSASWANLMPSGPLRVGADPVDPLDSATKGWVLRGLDDVGIWGLRNNHASDPENGAEVYGGRFDSSVAVAGAEKYRTSIQIQGRNNVDAWTRLATVNAIDPSTSPSWDFKYDGKIVFNKALAPSSVSASPGNTYATLPNTWMDSQYSGHVGFVGGGAGTAGGGWRNFISFGALIHPVAGSSHPHAMISQVFDYDLATGMQPNADIVRNTTFNAEAYDITFGNNVGSVNYLFSKSPVSDRALKHDIARIDTQVAYDNVMAMEYSSFVYNYDKKETVRRGFIAQQLEEIDPQYVRKYTNATGKEFLALDENVLLLDLIATVQHLAAKVEALESKLAEK